MDNLNGLFKSIKACEAMKTVKAMVSLVAFFEENAKEIEVDEEMDVVEITMDMRNVNRVVMLDGECVTWEEYVLSLFKGLCDVSFSYGDGHWVTIKFEELQEA